MKIITRTIMSFSMLCLLAVGTAAIAQQTVPEAQTSDQPGIMSKAIQAGQQEVARAGDALAQTAGPLQKMLDRLIGVLPSLIKAVVILFAYWAVAALVRLLLTKGLGAIGFDNRMKKFSPPHEVDGKTVGASAMVGRLAFYIILLFGITPFLDALGQRALVAPLQAMFTKVLEFIPNIVAAVVIFLIGKLIATIVREVVTNLLSAAGIDAGAEKLGLNKALGRQKISQICGLIVYLFIFIPIIISAIDSLEIKALSEPLTGLLEKILAAVPALLIAAVTLGIGYAIARLVKGVVESFLSGIGFDRLPEKLGLSFIKPKEGQSAPSAIGGTVVMFIILLLTAQQVLASLGLDSLAGAAAGALRYLPRLAVGLVILLAALSLGRFAGKMVGDATHGSGYGALIGGVANYAIVFLGASMALNQLGVSEEIVTTTVSMVLGAAALAFGLAFGLGGRDRAKELIERTGKKE
jgi:hypothetical protein